VSCSCTNTLLLIELPSERFLKKLAGKTDIEDALKRLDTLTNKEARMATAQVLKATRNIDNRVRGVDDRVVVVDDKVTGISDRVVIVDERVKVVDDKVAGVINGTRHSLSQRSKKVINSHAPTVGNLHQSAINSRDM
jgi:hypothetical protein